MRETLWCWRLGMLGRVVRKSAAISQDGGYAWSGAGGTWRREYRSGRRGVGVRLRRPHFTMTVMDSKRHLKQRCGLIRMVS